MLLPLVVPYLAAEVWAKRVIALLLIAIPAMLWSILVIQHVSVPLLPSAPYHPGPLWPGNPHRLFHSAIASAQLLVILHHPVRLALLPLANRVPGFLPISEQMIGMLGAFTIQLSQPLYLLFKLALVSAAGALLTTDPPIGQKRWAFPLVLLAALGCAELIYMVEYLTWTPVGFPRIDGVQGRYFLPLLPLLALLLGRLLPLPERFRWIWWIAPMVALIILDIQLPAIIAEHYYS